MELGLTKKESASQREQRLTLRNVRAEGHTYVELRKEGKRSIFFCILCFAPCFGPRVLFDHLNGELHTRMYATVKDTLLTSNPWPFNDGMHFFDNSREENEQLTIVNADQSRSLDTHKCNDNLAIVKHSANGDKIIDAEGIDVDSEVSAGNNANNYGRGIFLMVPGVLLKDEISELRLKYLGSGEIAARFHEKKYGVPHEMVRIWCEWLGEKSVGDEDTICLQEHDYAVINFRYDHELGLHSFMHFLTYVVLYGSMEEIEEGISSKSVRQKVQWKKHLEAAQIKCGGRTRKKSFSALEDVISNKYVKRELRQKHRNSAETKCVICKHKMLPGKDIATILNLKTKRLACCSRNSHGFFHVFHTSCLITWILLCEYEILTNEPVNPKERQKSRRKTAGKSDEKEKVGDAGPEGSQTQISSLFCPDCHGTGINMEGDQLENLKCSETQMFKYKIKASYAHRAWGKSPEVLLQNCSIGLTFPPQSEEIPEEYVSHLKLLHFYRADV